jgi:bifunctional ADP-heptose synthase (sugar kinase/adenylyltransferase)
MMQAANPKGILVVGDVMIDRTWRVRARSGLSTSQAHFGVESQEIADPMRKTDLLGAAGTVARAIKAIEPSCPVHLLGAWDDRIVDPGTLVPDESSGIMFRKIASVPFTTLKWRVFETQQQGNRLRHRYDCDLQRHHHRWIDAPTEESWPEPDQIAVVVVADFNKGLLEIDEVRERLCQYHDKHFLLRTKNPAETNLCLAKLPWTVLLANRADLRRISSHEFEVPRPSLHRMSAKAVTVHPELINSLQKLDKKLSGKLVEAHSCLVKLDSEGALRLEKGALTAFLPSMPSGRDAASAIGAGDCLAARLALALRADANDLAGACAIAVREASALCLRNDALDATPGWYGYPCHAADTDRSAVQVETVPGGSLEEAASDLSTRRRCLATLPQTRLHDGNWYLPGFLTLDVDLSEHLLRLRTSVDQYAKATRHVRPYVAAICGAPGQGKSTLARALAASSGCKFEPTNVAQWNGTEDLYLFLERLRTARLRGALPLAFIDEVDADVGAAKIYSKLLEPLWDGKYTLHGEERELGASIFVLAGSGNEWQTGHALLRHQDDDVAKLSDLVSRLCDIPVELPPLDQRKPDAILLAAAGFRRRFPMLKAISRRLVDFFATAHFNFGPRSLGQVVEMFGPLANDEVVTPRDFSGNSAALKLHTPQELATAAAPADTNDTIEILP